MDDDKRNTKWERRRKQENVNWRRQGKKNVTIEIITGFSIRSLEDNDRDGTMREMKWRIRPAKNNEGRMMWEARNFPSIHPHSLPSSLPPCLLLCTLIPCHPPLLPPSQQPFLPTCLTHFFLHRVTSCLRASLPLPLALSLCLPLSPMGPTCWVLN